MSKPSPPPEPAFDEAAAYLAALVSSSSDAIISKTLEGVITSWNDAAEKIFGFTAAEMIGAPLRTVIPPDRQHEEDDILERIARGERITHFETVRMHKSGALIDVSATISPIRDPSGRIIGASKILREIGERVARDRQLQIVMREVNHRSKNLLGVVQSIARQIALAHPDDFIARFNDRLQSLAACQDLLVQNEWSSIEMGSLIKAQLGHLDELRNGRIEVAGAPLLVSPDAAQQIGMALYELATNATKHGALSNSSGKVRIEWSMIAFDDPRESRFHLSWCEDGGPEVAAPTKQGFGTVVTTTMLNLGLKADVTADFTPAGLQWTMDVCGHRVLDP